MEDYPKSVTKECHEKILDQLNNSFYEIKNDEGKCGMGFFCKIKYDENKIIPVLITTYKLMNEDYHTNINVLIDKEYIKIEFGSINYINKNLDLSIIEIKENEIQKIKLLELDDNIYKNESEMDYDKESIYIIHKNNKNENCVSYGIVKEINNNELISICNINSNNSYGSPIFNLSNNKLIGIYKKNSKYYNKGIYFKYIINEINNIYTNKKDFNDNNNEIDIIIKVNKEDINKKIYFLDNEYEINDIKYSNHDNLKELNENNTELYRDGIKEKYKKYFIPKNEGEYNIKLKININLKNCSFMFAGCKNIIKINFNKFNTKYISNMKYMFYGCINLKNINLFCFNTKYVIDMSYMFKNCKNLKNLDISSFDFINVIDISYIFDDNYKNKYFDIIFSNRCNKLQALNLSVNNISDI